MSTLTRLKIERMFAKINFGIVAAPPFELAELRDLALRALEQTNRGSNLTEARGAQTLGRQEPQTAEADAPTTAAPNLEPTPIISTLAEKAAAFEWLRSVALSGHPKAIYAGTMLQEVAHHSEPQVPGSASAGTGESAAGSPARSEFAAWYKNRWPKSVDDDQDPQICALRDYMECAWNAALAETESPPTQETRPKGYQEIAGTAPAPALGGVPSNAELDALVERLCHAARMVSPGNPLIRVEWDAASAIVALRQRAEAAERDAARYRWARPILSGDDGNLADRRAIELATALIRGIDVDAAIDQCMIKRKAKP